MDELTEKKHLPTIIGKGYKSFWNFTGRYRCLKGGRGSNKSTTECFLEPYNKTKLEHQ